MKKLLLALLATIIVVCFFSCKNEKIAKSFFTTDTITAANFSGIELRINDNDHSKNDGVWNPEMSADDDNGYRQEPSIISIVW